MSAILHGTCIIISRPQYDEKIVAWRAYASVSPRNGGAFNYHQLKLEESFQTEREALDFGYAKARSWSDEQKSARPPLRDVFLKWLLSPAA